MLVKRFEFNPFGECTYVAWDPATRDAAIIDAGMVNATEHDTLDRYISAEGLHVTHILNTHLHIDHCVGAALASRRYGVPVRAHEADAPLARMLPQQAAFFHLRTPEPVQPLTDIRPLHDGDIIIVGDSRLRVIAVPGHSPGGVAFYDAADGILFSGDSLFNGSIGRTDLPGGDHSVLLEAIQTRLFTLPPETIVYPGHGPSTTIGREQTSNPFFA